ncbi:MAG: O-antigen ligase family protein, partial [Gemmatimonadales bacterium]
LQYRAGPASALAGGQYSAERHGASVLYYLPGEETQFRAFSTFTFPAPFAGMMVFGMILIGGIALERSRPLFQRYLLASLMAILFVAMTLSGTRAALVELFLGLAVLAFLRGFTLMQIALAIPVAVALHFGVLLTSGHAVARFGSIFTQEGHLWIYVSGPIITAGRTLSAHFFGLGLGRTGVGVPFAIASSMPAGYFVFSDGDIGRAAVDMGVLGLIVLAFIVFGLMPLTLRAARMLIETEEEGVALGMGALVLSGGVIILIGSPLSGAPHGIIWWFFLGALVRLAMLRSQADAHEANEEEVEEEEV